MKGKIVETVGTPEESKGGGEEEREMIRKGKT
jgi:hypothetical protein